MLDRLDPHARQAFEVAQAEARMLDHDYLGTEHLLVALAGQTGMASRLLADAGCRPDDLRADIVLLVGRGRRPHGPDGPDALLATLGVDLGEVRRRVESTFGEGAMHDAALRVRPRRRARLGRRWWPGCDQERPCQSALLGWPRLGIAPRVKRILERVTTGAAPGMASPLHLLVGILDEGSGVACRILSRRGVDLAALADAARAGLR